MFGGKTLLVTGGTGSFGGVVAERFLKENIKEIRIFSRDEKKQEDMRIKYDDARLKFYIGDIRDIASLRDSLRGVDMVFHAAALKQVPSCEFYPLEAVKTNVIGTENVIAAALAASVERVIVLSTDKAVYPVNAMGLSKAMMEKITIAKARGLSQSDTVLCTTRYGNVMASRGSVIPLFISQIKAGQDLTLTDPRMTRFVMSLSEAVDLVLHAYEHASQGDIFIMKSPAATIQVTAEALLRIFKSTARLRTIGTRHGEKLYETLVSREETVRAVDLGRFFRIPADIRDLNYGKFTVQGQPIVNDALDYTSHNAKRLSVDEMVELLVGLDYIQDELKSTSLRSSGV